MASEFELAKRQDDGMTLRDHLKAYEQQTGKVHPEMANRAALPSACQQVFSDFTELHCARGSTGFGPARITFVDIDAWERVNGLKLDAWEIEAIRAGDDAYMASIA